MNDMEFLLQVQRSKEPSLTEVLEDAGFSHRKSDKGVYAHDILDAEGNVVFVGTADKVWKWLKENCNGSDPTVVRGV